jgi:hypothetical protein
VPANPIEVQEASEKIFALLDHATAPRMAIYERRSSFFGCGCSAGTEEVSVTGSAVTVEQSGAVGHYDYAVLSADDARPLMAWLNEHQYAIPDTAAEALQHYLARGWHFLALRLRADPDAQRLLAPHPITYRYESQSLVFPLVISRVSADEENEILLYILAEMTYVPNNWRIHTIDEADLRPVRQSPSRTNYEQLLRAATFDDHAFVLELTGPSQIAGTLPLDLGDAPAMPLRLTRLRAVMPPNRMDRDVVLVPRPFAHDVKRDFHVGPPHASPATALALPLLLAAGLLMPASRPRPPHTARTLGAARIARATCLIAAGMLLIL